MTREPDPDDDGAEEGFEDQLQDLIGSVRRRPGDDDDQELDFSLGGKLSPDHPDADVLDDLDL